MPGAMRFAAIPAIACMLAAPAFAVELSGAIRSSTGTLPAAIMLPIEDPEHLDERRAAMGMQPFASYKAMLLGE
jgi:hypothetical protein